jgi:spore germination cell wall hydrolase CwlJ-like protein
MDDTGPQDLAAKQCFDGATKLLDKIHEDLARVQAGDLVPIAEVSAPPAEDSQKVRRDLFTVSASTTPTFLLSLSFALSIAGSVLGASLPDGQKPQSRPVERLQQSQRQAWPKMAPSIAKEVLAASAEAGPFVRPPYGETFGHVSTSERDCLRRAVYYEARGEPIAGQIAVAQVVLNRVMSGRWRSSICGVVHQGAERGRKCQFSFACQTSLLSAPWGQAWQQSMWVADEVLDNGAWLREMREATHFHRPDLNPVWTRGLKKIRRIGSHVFYTTPDASPDMVFAAADAATIEVRQVIPFADPED